MSEANRRLVTDFCNALMAGTDKLVEFLSEDVHYHNMPWPPVTGHDGVRTVLAPLVDADPCALRKMEIHHTLAEGDTVMNARDETWEHKGVTCVLPVAGVFRIRDGKITHWSDYFDVKTIQPLLDVQ